MKSVDAKMNASIMEASSVHANRVCAAGWLGWRGQCPLFGARVGMTKPLARRGGRDVCPL